MQRSERQIGALLLGTLAAFLAFAESDADAQRARSTGDVARAVESFYSQTSSVRARFHQTYYHRLYDRMQRSIGRLVAARPGRIRFDYGRPAHRVIAGNTETVTIWEALESDRAGQYTQVPGNEAAFATVFGFFVGSRPLAQDYRLRLLDSHSYRFDGDVLELTPRRADPHTRRILLFVENSVRLAGVVRRVRIDDHDGNRNKFELADLEFNRPVGQETFAFRPPAGARRL